MSPVGAPSPVSASTIEEAIARGSRHLATRAEDDHWRGFPTLAGTSDLWVTAFVVWHLANVGRQSSLLSSARRYLAAHRGEEGWGYSPAVPPDSDSTAWCLAALRRSRSLDPSARRDAIAFVLDHLDEDGGVGTYLPGSGIRQFIEAGSTSTAGWTSAHPDVTAVALLTDAFGRGGRPAIRSLQWLVESQDRAGVVPAYWWRPRYYTAAMLLRACLRHGVRPPSVFVSRLVELLAGKQLGDGGYGLGSSPVADPFTTALALECLTHLSEWTDRGGRARAAACLLDAQRLDGGWNGDLVLRIPAPSVIDPLHVDLWRTGTGGGNSYVPDEHGVFATALASYAIDLYRQSEDGRYRGLGADLPRLDLPVPEVDQTVAEVTNPLPESAEHCSSPLG